MIPIYLATAKGVSNYKVDVKMFMTVQKGGQKLSCQSDFRAILDTGAAPVIIRRSAVPEGTTIYAMKDAPLLIDAQRKAISVCGVVQGTVRMGAGVYEVNALVAEELSVDLLLGTQFIDSYVLLINPRRRVVLMDKGDEVSLVDCAFKKTEQVLVAERIRIPPKSEAIVPVRSDAKGLNLLTSMDRRRTAVTNGLHQLEGGAVFLTKVGNFSDQFVTLTPGTVIARATPHDENVMLNVELDEPESAKENWLKELDLSNLEDAQKDAVKDVLEKHAHLWDKNRLGVIQGTKHRIVTTGNPVFQHPYRAGPAARENEKQEVDRMLKLGVIEPSSAEWASPVVLIPKPDGSTRFCVDYRRLNGLTARDVYPLPRMDECLDSLGDAEYFTTLDANTGFWQIEVDPTDRDKPPSPVTWACIDLLGCRWD
jgi:hypothetical protein